MCNNPEHVLLKTGSWVVRRIGYIQVYILEAEYSHLRSNLGMREVKDFL